MDVFLSGAAATFVSLTVWEDVTVPERLFLSLIWPAWLLEVVGQSVQPSSE